ncbi:MAG: hypothetical protein R3Y68_08340 [Rikenellaceae bacterium]
MRGKVELYILFPKHDSVGNVDKYKIINCCPLKDSDELDQYIRAIDTALQFIDHEEYDGFYDTENISDFLAPITTLGEEYYPQSKRYLTTILKNFEQYDNTLNGREHIRVNNVEIGDDMICEVAKRSFAAEYNRHLILNHEAISSRNIVAEYSGETKAIGNCKIRDIDELYQWFNKNRLPERQYNHNPKHGENGRGNQVGESVLMCSQAVAKELLQNALGCSYESKHLFLFDVVHKCIIEFRNENTANNSYHAFHTSNVSRIPKSVVDKIKQVQGNVLP